MTLAVIAHIADPSIAVLRDRIHASGRKLEIYRPFGGDKLPDPRHVDGLVVLGGPQSAYDHEAHPYLRDEIDYLAEVQKLEVPTLAICLGSHLLAEATGGVAIPGEDGLEAGLIEVRSIAGDFPPPGTYFSFHSDSMQLPEDAELLAVSDRYIQAWRLGASLAVQFHPELDAAGFEAVLDAEEEKIARFGVDVPAIRSAIDRPVSSPTPAEQLIDAWLGGLPTDVGR